MKSGREDHGASIEGIVAYLDDILQTTATPDYPNAFNGLQLSNRGFVTRAAAAVDFSTQTVEQAIREDANLLIVHHGMFWGGAQPIVGKTLARFRALIEADVAVYASHLPLDRHPQLGNNVLLARKLGLEPSGDFAQYENIFVGVQGRSDVPTSMLLERSRVFSRENGGDAIWAGDTNPNRTTHRWGICTGSGASAETLLEASKDGIDTLIVGEGPHWTAVDAFERGIAVIYVGHYASETLGVNALAHEVSQHFNIGWVKISAPTGL